MSTEKENEALKTIHEKIDTFNVKMQNLNEKLNDGSKHSKAIIWGVALVLGALITYCKHN